MNEFDPIEFALISDVIVDNGSMDKEGRTRVALSRAYYALFLSIRTAIRKAEGRPTDGNNDQVKHGDLSNALYGAQDARLSALAKILSELYDARRQADYILNPKDKWKRNCQKPDFAKKKLRITKSTIRSLSGLDFSKVVGKV